MKLADRWDVIVDRLPNDWSRARTTLAVDDAARPDRAATPDSAASSRAATATCSGSRPQPVASARRRPARSRPSSHELDAAGFGARISLGELESPRPRQRLALRCNPGSTSVGRAPLDVPPDWSDVMKIELPRARTSPRCAPLRPVNASSARATRLALPCRPPVRLQRRALHGAGRSSDLDDPAIAGRLGVVHMISDSRRASTRGPVRRARPPRRLTRLRPSAGRPGRRSHPPHRTILRFARAASPAERRG